MAYINGKQILKVEVIGSGMDEFWSNYQQGGYRRHFNYAFAGGGWIDSTYNPPYDFGEITYANYMFANNEITDTKIPIDISKASSATIYGMFGGATKLKTIRPITISEKIVLSSGFTSCYALENITFDGVIGQDINFSSCSKLTHDSLISIINALKDGVTSKTLTLPKTFENITEEQVTTEIAKATEKGWTVAR